MKFRQKKTVAKENSVFERMYRYLDDFVDYLFKYTPVYTIILYRRIFV